MTTANLNDVETESRSASTAGRPERSGPSRRNEPNALFRLLRPFASLTLTVVLLALSIVIIFAGTWAQRFNDVWHVQQQYFHSLYCFIEMNLFLPVATPQNGFWAAVVKVLRPVRIPMIGGYTLIGLMLVNLLAAHATRFKPKWGDLYLIPLLALMLFLPEWVIPNAPTSWMSVTLGGVPLFTMLAYTPLLAVFAATVAKLHGKRTGIILTHLALIILLAGELITSRYAVESRMVIEEGQTTNFTSDLREAELAVIDPTASADTDRLVAFPRSMLTKGAVLKHPAVPFEIKLDDYYANAGLLGPAQARQRNVTDRATAGELKGQIVAVEQARVSGVGAEASAVDTPAAYATLTAGGQALGTYLLSTAVERPQTVEVNGKAYQIDLRFRRHYRPYSLHLKDFSFDRYAGTEVAKNYSALVQLVDPAHGVNREVRIWMNHPLRYAGETFFQSSFDPRTEKTTILQVVKNPGERFPYIACALGAIGLLIHFGITLIRFIERQNAAAAPATVVTAVPVAANGGRAKGSRARNGNDRGPSYTLEPRSRAAIWLPMVVIGLVAVYLMSLFGRAPERKAGEFDYAAFGRIPISYEGRQQPLDSLARNALRVLSGKGKLQIEIENPSAIRQLLGLTTRSKPATQWLLEMWTPSSKADDYRVIRIDHDDVKRLIAPSDPAKQKEFVERKLFSFNEVIASGQKIDQQFALLRQVKPADRDAYQTKLAELGEKLNVYVGLHLERFGGLYLVPPAKPGGEWRQVAPVFQAAQQNGGQVDPLAQGLMDVLRASNSGQPEEFNGAVAGYLARVDAKFPDVAARTGSETLFNRVDPFTQAFVFYILIFLLVIFSWLLAGGRWGRPLYFAAASTLVLTLVYHTAALGWRVYLSGRPPVTNLYSSAIFIAWGAALLAAGLELFFRNGIGILTAAVVGAASLLISINLVEGDTMKVLQAVLDTNFWLATHVVIITLGYAATFLAGILAVVYVVKGLLTPTLDRASAKDLSRMVYGILCFALLFSFVGTILGGIWADQSWGRFWGWDPKENGAALIVLWNALILHARWGGLVRERGLMNLAIFGNVVTAWSWFGTNMLGIGLHSYGFMESALFWLALFIFSQLALIAAGSLPLRLWRSFREGGEGGPAAVGA